MTTTASSTDSFGGLLRQLRLAASLSQEQLGERAHLSSTAIAALERGRRAAPRPGTVLLLADALRLSAADRAAFIAAAGAAREGRRVQAAAVVPVALSAMPGPPLPSGTVTFLFTDIEGSTRLLEQHLQAYSAALDRHYALLHAAIDAHGGTVFETVGDALYAVFARAQDAVGAALDAQLALYAEAWGDLGALRVRMALHTGDVERRGEHYFGPALYRCARLMAATHGGQVVLSGTTADLVRDASPPKASLRALGTHRLKDLAEPERVFQLLHPRLRDQFPPLQGVDPGRRQLPFPLTSFVGREQEVAAVRRLLATHRLVTLTGPGGVGKTRLALAVAATLVGAEFEDGAFFVDLAPLRDPNLVTSSLAQTLGVQEGGRPLLDLVTEYLRDRHTLLLIDNFEQVLAGAAGIATLLERCPRLVVLVTSRAPLRLQGEQTYTVPPLGLPDLQHPASPGALAEVASVDLFVQRARAVQPEFSLTDSSARTVGEICARLDGLPLAIELAAARVRVLSPQGILARLGNRLALLTAGRRDEPQRHQTLRTAIDWSYELLSPAEQTLFRRLAVFSGGCTVEAVEAVCLADDTVELDVLDGLTALLEWSLLRHAAQGADGQPRFGMLETIREYALERLADSGELAGVAARHAQYFLAFARHNRALAGALVMRLDRLEAEHDNLRASLQWELDHGEPEDALELALACTDLWITRGHLSEGQRWLERALARAAKLVPASAMQARALRRAGTIAWHRGEYPRATLLYERALAMAREIGEPVDIARAVTSLGTLARDQGKYEQAASLFAEGLERFQAMGETGGIAVVFANLGVLARARGDYAEAVSLGERSLGLHRQFGDIRNMARSCAHIGRAAACLGDTDRSVAVLSEGMLLARQLGDRWTLAQCLEGLAAIALAAGEPARAATLLGAGASLRERIGHPPSVPESAELDRLITDVRQPLGEAEWTAALAAGRAMEFDQVLAWAAPAVGPGDQRGRVDQRAPEVIEVARPGEHAGTFDRSGLLPA